MLLTKRKIITAQSALDSLGLLSQSEIEAGDGFLFQVKFGAGTSAGSVVIETADDDTFTGVWAVLQTIAWAAANRQHQYYAPGPQLSIRARISVAIVGGTIDVTAKVVGS